MRDHSEMSFKIDRIVRFVLKELKWIFVRIPFFALVIMIPYIISPAAHLSFLQVGLVTLCVLFAKDYLNWIDKQDKCSNK